MFTKTTTLLGLLLTASVGLAYGEQIVLKDEAQTALKDAVLGKGGVVTTGNSRVGENAKGVGCKSKHRGGENLETLAEICGTCVRRGEIVRPGVGLDLSVGYGTAAIRYHDKAIVDVEKLVGNNEYIELMKRLSPPYVQYGPPFDSIADQIRYDLDQAKRAIRKAQGLPQTKDIETLAIFIAELFALTSATADVPLGNQVVISTTLMPNLPDGDFDEALKFANLTRIVSPKSAHAPLSQTNVGLAGMGYGICKYWSDYAGCMEEEINSGVKALITIGYTNEELSIESAYAYTAYWVYPDIHVQYPELGYNHTNTNHQDSSEHSDDYWLAIKERITTSLKATDMVPDTLLLLGETAANKKFYEVVIEALGEMEMEWKAKGVEDWKKVLRSYEYGIQERKKPLMLAARGAAEFAKRIQGEPDQCVEGDWCHNRVPGEDGVPSDPPEKEVMIVQHDWLSRKTFITKKSDPGDYHYRDHHRDRIELEGFEAKYERDPEKEYIVEYTY